MLTFLIKFVVIVAVVFCVRLLMPVLGLPEPFATVVLVILGIIGLLYLVGWIPGGEIKIP